MRIIIIIIIITIIYYFLASFLSYNIGYFSFL